MNRIRMISGDPDSPRGPLIQGVAYFQRLLLSYGVSIEEGNSVLRWADAVESDDLPDRMEGLTGRESFLIGMLAASLRLGEMTWPATRGEYKARRAGRTARSKREANTDARRKKLAAAVKERIRKRGRHKVPSTTSIYADVATAHGVSVPTVRRACGKK